MLWSTNTRVHIFFYKFISCKCTAFPFRILICKGVKFTLFHKIANCRVLYDFCFSWTQIITKLITQSIIKYLMKPQTLIYFSVIIIIFYIMHPFKMFDDVVVNQIFDRISALLTLVNTWVLCLPRCQKHNFFYC